MGKDVENLETYSGAVTGTEKQETVRVAKYECKKTKYNNVYKVIKEKGKYIARCYYGQKEVIDKKKWRDPQKTRN